MANLFQGITDAIGSFFASPVVQFGFRAIAVYWVLLWLAASYWAFRDLQMRTDNQILPYLAAAFVIVFTPILFPAAIVVYRVVRPQERSDEVYERTLAQEAMLAEIEGVPTCPSCRRRVREEWIACPTCRTRLSRPCPGCDRLAGLDWAICGWCGRDLGMREPAAEGQGERQVAPSIEAAPASPPASGAPGAAAARTRPTPNRTSRPAPER